MESIQILKQFRAAGIGVTLWQDNTTCCPHQTSEGAIHITLQNNIAGPDGFVRTVGFYRPCDLARLRVVLDVVEELLKDIASTVRQEDAACITRVADIEKWHLHLRQSPAA